MKHLGQTTESERKTALTMGLKMIVMTKIVKTLRMTRLRRLDLLWALSRGGAGNKYTFHKVLQNVFFVRICNCTMHLFLQAFANMLLQKYLGFTSFSAKLQVWFAVFSKDLQAFKFMAQW